MTSYASDLELARKLQSDLNSEIDMFDADETLNPVQTARKRASSDDLNATQNLVHPDWETKDPTPDVQSLFGAFDMKFFKGKLRCVQLEWSKKMYQCAGICYYRRNAMGSSITIRLSEPLLKLRQRKDLVETMLHEMIHAYLFVMNIREGNGGHGPNFKRIMVSINQTAGTNITVYHTFHDEVNLYKTHVWRCNGLCQHRKPFFGYVRRTCNRAPGPNDQWWAQHTSTCGGYFAKVSEPTKEAKVKRQRTESVPTKPRVSSVQRIDNPKWGMGKPPAAKAASSVRTITAPPRSKTITSDAPTIKRPPLSGNLQNVRGFRDLNTSGDSEDESQPGASQPKKSIVGGNLRNVIGFKDLNGGSSSKAGAQINSPGSMSSRGFTLGGSSGPARSSSSGVPDASRVRDLWSKRFPSTDTNPRRSSTPSAKPSNVSNLPKGVTASSSNWNLVDDDDDVLIHETKHEIIQLSDDDEDVFVAPLPVPLTQIKVDPDERLRAIMTDIMHDSDDEDDIIIIDDDFDDDLLDTSAEVADTSVIDDLFGSDSLMSEFHAINDAMPGQPHDEEIISCPICTEKMCRDLLSEHLNGCQGIKIEVHAKRRVSDSHVKGLFRPIREKTERELLADCGYTKEEIDVALGEGDETPEERAYNRRIETEMREEEIKRIRESRYPGSVAAETAVAAAFEEVVEEEKFDCPGCVKRFSMAEINAHLDVCLLD